MLYALLGWADARYAGKRAQMLVAAPSRKEGAREMVPWTASPPCPWPLLVRPRKIGAFHSFFLALFLIALTPDVALGLTFLASRRETKTHHPCPGCVPSLKARRRRGRSGHGASFKSPESSWCLDCIFCCCCFFFHAVIVAASPSRLNGFGGLSSAWSGRYQDAGYVFSSLFFASLKWSTADHEDCVCG